PAPTHPPPTNTPEATKQPTTGHKLPSPNPTANANTSPLSLHDALPILTNVANGLTANNITGNGTGTVVLTGTVDQINATLAATNDLKYLSLHSLHDPLSDATHYQDTKPQLTATSNVTINVTQMLHASNT